MASRLNIDFAAEYIFSLDLVTCVLQQYIPDWKPVYLIKQENIVSHFTPNIRKIIEHIIDVRIGHYASLVFDYWFKDNEINLNNFRSLGETLTVDFCMDRYRSQVLIETSSLVAELSALAYIYGELSAPHYAIIYITHMICYSKGKKEFCDSSWLKLDKRAKFMLACDGIFITESKSV